MTSEPGPPDVAELVTRYLRLVEARRLDEAATYLAPGVRITFPGGRTFSTLEQQVASSAGRFRRVEKRFDGVDTSDQGERAVVYVWGTLQGEDLDGRPFTGVRFVDRFEVRDGLIAEQAVWNDLAETGVVSLPEEMA
jgi:hypothetical protein